MCAPVIFSIFEAGISGDGRNVPRLVQMECIFYMIVYLWNPPRPIFRHHAGYRVPFCNHADKFDIGQGRVGLKGVYEFCIP